MLNSIKDDTDPCGKPFACFHYELMLSPMLTRNQRSPNSVCTSCANHGSMQVESLDRMPVCQTVLCAAVTSSNTAPVFRFYWNPFSMYHYVMPLHKKVKVAHMWLPSIGSRSWSPFLAVSLQMMWVINLPLLSSRPAVTLATLKRTATTFCCWVNRGTMCVNSLPKTVTRQRRSFDVNPCLTAPESSMLTTRLPSHMPPHGQI